MRKFWTSSSVTWLIHKGSYACQMHVEITPVYADQTQSQLCIVKSCKIVYTYVVCR